MYGKPKSNGPHGALHRVGPGGIAAAGACLAALVLATGCGSGKASPSASATGASTGASTSGSVSGSASSSASSSASAAGTETSGSVTGTSSSSQAKGKVKSGLAFTKGQTPNWATVPASTAAQSGLVAITYRNFAINPDAVKVKVGSTLKWTNYDPVATNVTSIGPGAAKLASGSFGEGKSFTVKVTKPGVIHYESTNYPTTMNGTIVVVE